VNPFPEDAVVDIVSVADGEEVRSPDFQQVPVPAKSRRSIPLHERILRKDRVATTVVATRGRVAAAESTFLLEEPFGASLMIGATAPAPNWFFGEGYAGSGVTQTINVFNPGDQEASVGVDLLVEAGPPPTAKVVKVPGHGRSDLVLGVDLPEATPYSVRVSASAPVVVSRSQIFAAPNPLRGFLFTLGTVAPARAWVLPEGSADPPFDAYVSIANPGSSVATVQLGVLTGGAVTVPANLRALDIAAGRRTSVHVPIYLSGSDLALAVTSDEPVVVETSLYMTAPRYGSTAGPAIPVEGGFTFPVSAIAAKPPPTTTTTTTLPLTPTAPAEVTPTAPPPGPPPPAPAPDSSAPTG
jgi:hypothetical protein